MQIKIIGARALNSIADKRIIKHASARFCGRGNCLQIDAGNEFSGPARNFLITHLHSDHIAKIGTIPKDSKVFVPDKSFADYLSAKTRATMQIIKPEKKTKIEDFMVTAFPVRHSSHTKTFGYRVETGDKAIVWLPDFRRLSGSLKYFRNLDILFLGASCFERNINHGRSAEYGHQSIINSLKILRQNSIKPKKVVLIHIGRQLCPLNEKLKILHEMFPDFSLQAAFDGEIFR